MEIIRKLIRSLNPYERKQMEAMQEKVAMQEELIAEQEAALVELAEIIGGGEE